MSIEQIFDDIDACKNQILSALGQDPNHDFRSGERTFNKTTGKGANKQITPAGADIMKKMTSLLQLCERRAKPAAGGSMVGGGDSSSLGQIILSNNTTNQQIMVLTNNVSTDLVKTVTNLIFADGLEIAIKSASLLTNPDVDGNYNSNINQSLNNLLNYGNLQENFFNKALGILGTLNEITSIKFVRENYPPLFDALKNPLGNDIKSTLNQVETSSIEFLNNQVAEVLEGSGNTCLYDLNSSIQLINSYATNELVNTTPIDINSFIQLSKVDQVSKLESLNRKILAKLHSDRNINATDEEKESKDELYKDANNQINDMIESCFRSGNVLGQKRKIFDDDVDQVDDNDTIQKRRKVKVRRQITQFGGGKSGVNYKLLNNKILNSSTAFMMRWLGVAEWNDDQLHSVTPIYSNIFESGGADYLMRDSVIHKDSNGISRKINPARITLNAQIAILWARINYSGAVKFKNDMRRMPLDPQYFDILSVAKKKQDNNYWFGQDGAISVGSSSELGWRDIDNQLQAAHNIVIRTYYPESIYKEYGKPDKFPLTSNDQGLDNVGKTTIGANKNADVSFLVNNASDLTDVNIGGLSGDTLSKLTFCPIASVLDAMKNCSIGSALRDNSAVLYPMTYTISSADREFLYTVSYTPTKDGKSAILNATLSKSISDFGPSGNLFTISKKDLVFTDKDLSATEGYRAIIEDLLSMAENLGREGRQLRGRDTISIFQDFLNQVMNEMIGSFAVKSIGDYSQEGTVTSTYSGVAGNDNPENYTMGKTTLSPTQDSGFSFRIGVSGDRPSAYRMVDTLLYANPTSINIDAIVGYIDGDSQKNFLVINPTILDNNAVKKLQNLDKIREGDNFDPDNTYSPEVLSKSLLRSKYCRANPSKCIGNTSKTRQGGKSKRKTRKRKYKKRKTNKRRRRKKKTKRRKSTRKTKRNKRKN